MTAPSLRLTLQTIMDLSMIFFKVKVVLFVSVLLLVCFVFVVVAVFVFFAVLAKKKLADILGP